MTHEDKVAHVYKQGQWPASHQDGCKTSGSSVPNGNSGSENSLHQALHMPAVEYTYLCSVLQCGMDPQQTRSRSVCAWEVSWGWENLLIFILLTDFSPLFTSAHSTPASLTLPVSPAAAYSCPTDISTVVWDPFALCWSHQARDYLIFDNRMPRQAIMNYSSAKTT